MAISNIESASANGGRAIIARCVALLALLAPSGACSDAATSDVATGGSAAGAIFVAGAPSGGSTSSSGGAGDAGASGDTSASGGNAGGAGTAGGAAGGISAGGSAGSAMAGSGAGGGTSHYANFATMSEIVMIKCGGSGCHSGGTQPTLLGSSDAELYTTLTTYVSKLCGNRLLVKAGSPQDSAFFMAQNGECGALMPRMPKGCVDNCTPADYLEGVRQWISNGAKQQ